MPAIPDASVWLLARFVAGVAVAGVFVVVESWLLHGNEADRAKRVGLYMGAFYGGSSLGQLCLGFVGVHGVMPFVAIFTALLFAVGVLLLIKSDQPSSAEITPLWGSRDFPL